MVPVLLRDSHRLADAQRCRPGRAPSRFALLRAARRAFSIVRSTSPRRSRSAATAPRDAARGVTRRPWSRQDLAFTGRPPSRVAALAVAGRVAGLAPFQAYPMLHAPLASPAGARGRGSRGGARAVRCPAGDRAMSDARASSGSATRSRGAERPALDDVSLSPGRASWSCRGRIGLGQVDAAGHRERARAPFPRRGVRRAGEDRRDGRFAIMVPANSPRRWERCSRIPRRRW